MPASDTLPPAPTAKTTGQTPISPTVRRDPKVSRSSVPRASLTAPPTRIWRGWPYPLGATWLGNGTNFSIFSQHATGVELCLFNGLGEPETARVRLTEMRDNIWHGFLPEVRPG